MLLTMYGAYETEESRRFSFLWLMISPLFFSECSSLSRRSLSLHLRPRSTRVMDSCFAGAKCSCASIFDLYEELENSCPAFANSESPHEHRKSAWSEDTLFSCCHSPRTSVKEVKSSKFVNKSKTSSCKVRNQDNSGGQQQAGNGDDKYNKPLSSKSSSGLSDGDYNQPLSSPKISSISSVINELDGGDKCTNVDRLILDGSSFEESSPLPGSVMNTFENPRWLPPKGTPFRLAPPGGLPIALYNTDWPEASSDFAACGSVSKDNKLCSSQFLRQTDSAKDDEKTPPAQMPPIMPYEFADTYF